MSRIKSKNLLLMFIFSALLDCSSYGQKVSFSHTEGEIQVNDFIEFSIDFTVPLEGINPFTDVEIIGDFYLENSKHKKIYGFCDSQDGKTFRLRFMPEIYGNYSFKIQIRFNDYHEEFKGKFTAINSYIRGIVDVCKEFPTHFKFRREL